MDDTLTSLIEEWDGLGTVVSRHRETGAWIFIALHDATLGRPTGGCRLREYPSPADGLRDAMRLAEAMTYKWASMEMPCGGGKAVLATSGPIEAGARRSLLSRFGEVVNALRGGFLTGPDLGTTSDDISYLGKATRWVHCATGAAAGADPGRFTAAGVLAGIRAAAAHLDGSADLVGKSVLVQGVGAVGGPLARLLRDAGAAVMASDIDVDLAHEVAVACDGAVVSPRDVYGVQCDVYAPCAVGATLNATTVPELRCRIVAGSANNQLAGRSDADALHERGILYAPDFVVSGGGAMGFGLMARGLVGAVEAEEEVARRIGSALAEVFGEAERSGASPVVVARRRAERVLARGAPTGSAGV